ncbi:MAG: hypothetical protein KAQ85_00800 [Thermodesulfovibrionia bacterium]|nr:hypothetical protein [Thermodesulfovibrionia bacterium]
MVFGFLGDVAKAVVGVALSPVSMAADVLTLGGAIIDRDEPYTVSSMRQVMRNLELAFDPDKLSDKEIAKIIAEINRK